MTATLNDLASCAGCLGTLGPAARPVRLLDLVFHKVCAPGCRSCGKRLSVLDESLWRYTARPMAGGERCRASSPPPQNITSASNPLPISLTFPKLRSALPYA